MTLRKPAAIALLAAPLSMAACTFLVQFEDKDPDETDSGVRVDGSGLPDVNVPVPDATPPDAPSKPNPCVGQNDGANWSAQDRTARCCGGQAVLVDSPETCGGCGIRCAAGQTCELISDHYYCVGCASGGTADDAKCATSTGCCSKQYNSAGLCAASTCIVGGSTCKDALCSPIGAQCLLPTGASYVCSYWQ